MQLPECRRIITQGPGDARATAELVNAIRGLPGQTVLTANPGYALLARKRLPRNYYSGDSFAASLSGKFNKMIEDSLNESDCIVVDLRIIEHIDRANIDRIIRSGSRFIATARQSAPRGRPSPAPKKTPAEPTI